MKQEAVNTSPFGVPDHIDSFVAIRQLHEIHRATHQAKLELKRMLVADRESNAGQQSRWACVRLVALLLASGAAPGSLAPVTAKA